MKFLTLLLPAVDDNFSFRSQKVFPFQQQSVSPGGQINAENPTLTQSRSRTSGGFSLASREEATPSAVSTFKPDHRSVEHR